VGDTIDILRNPAPKAAHRRRSNVPHPSRHRPWGSALLTSTDLDCLLATLAMPDAGRSLVRHVRSSPPARTVGRSRGKPWFTFASRKMLRGIQAESGSVEFAACYLYEADESVLEFWDQPTVLSVRYQHEDGRVSGGTTTPDYLVVERDGVRLDEWKQEQRLRRLAAEAPHIYQWDGQRWCSPAREAAAREFGLDYCLRSSLEIGEILYSNLELLNEYRVGGLTVPPETDEAVRSCLSTHGALKLEALLATVPGLTQDDVFTMLVQGRVHADLRAARLLEPARAMVALTPERVRAYRLFEEATPAAIESLTTATLTGGQRVLWDGVAWTILNAGREHVTIRCDDGRLQDVAREEFMRLMGAGRLVDIAHSADDPLGAAVRDRLRLATEEDLRVAHERLRLVEAGEPVEAVHGTRWLRELRRRMAHAERTYGFAFLGLLPRTRRRGNREARFPDETRELFEEMRQEHHVKVGGSSRLGSYRLFEGRAREVGVPCPSYYTYCRWLESARTHRDDVRSKGWKGAYGDLEYAGHHRERDMMARAQRAWQKGYLDFYRAPVCLVSERFVILGSAWVGLLFDDYSAYPLAWTIDFDEPSATGVMAVVRDCVRRWNRLPEIVVVDLGPEFQNVYLDTLLVRARVSKMNRPASEPRYGAPEERMFGTTQVQLVHQLRGHTRALQNVRMVSREVNPEALAVWTMPDFRDAVEDYLYQHYVKRPHPGLNGMSPETALSESVALSGERRHRRIAYDDTFRILTLPSPPRPAVKITSPGKIRVLHLDYWCPELRDRGLWGTSVKVRYDPDDRGHVEAWVCGQWRECTSEHHRVFKGRSQREIEVAARIFAREQSAVRNLRTDPSGYRLAAILERAHEYEALRLAELKQQEKQRTGSAWRRLEGREDLTPAAAGDLEPAADSAVTVPFPTDRVRRLADFDLSDER
jgi:putative transposase